MKTAVLLIVLSVFLVGSALALLNNPAQSSQVPPTPAYANFTILDDQTWPNETNTSIVALSYRDPVYLSSDGSIEINFTNYP